MAAGGLPTLLYRMGHKEAGVQTAAARGLRNLTAHASTDIKSVVAHNGGAEACIKLLAEVGPGPLLRGGTSLPPGFSP